MTSDENRTFHRQDHLFGNISPVASGESRNGCSNDLFISEPFETTQYSEKQTHFKYETIASTNKTKKLRRDERSMSLRRPSKKLDDFDRSLSISLEEILQGINETKSPPATSNNALVFTSPIASPERRIEGQFTEYPVDVAFLETDEPCIGESNINTQDNTSHNGMLYKKQKHTDSQCFNDFDSNNNTKFRNANKNDVIRDRREGLLNLFPNTNFQNKPSLPSGHSKIDLPTSMNWKSANTHRSELWENAHNPVYHKRSLVPPTSLNLAQENLPVNENDLSPSSNEVHDILRHASADSETTDDDLSSYYDTDEEHSSSSATQDVFPEYCTQMSSLTLVPSEDETVVGSCGGL